MRFFYGLYVKDPALAAALDLIRFLAEPNFFRRAHITVRGPYTSRAENHIEEINKGHTYPILFRGIGSFFGKSQHTVFLKCEVPGIEKIWNKPDFAGDITPHITFYDGKDRGLAFGILHQLELHKWEFATDSTELVEIESKSDAAALNEFRLHQNTYNEILGRNIDFREVRSLHWRQRVVLISWVADFIGKHYSYGR